MSKPMSVGDKLAMLTAVRGDLLSPESVDLLRRSLEDRSNHVIERAADVVGEAGHKGFIDDLTKTYRRLVISPSKRDPGCVGKTALVRAIVKLEHDDASFYREGVTYEQQEPVWGGRKDTAARLRGLCAIGLSISASTLEVLNRCAILLADPWVDARTGAVQALATLAQPEGAPLLKLKLLTGDGSSEVIGECCSALLRLTRDDGIEFVVQLLSSADKDVCVQAALALGESRHPSAFEPLRAAWEHQSDLNVRESLLVCIGLLRSSEVGDFLLSLVSRGDSRAASDAIRALKIYGGDGTRRRVENAVAATRSVRLESVFEEEWGEQQ